MKGTMAYQILKDHLVDGTIEPGKEIGIRIDHCLLQDATGTMADLQFEALDIPRVKAELAVSSLAILSILSLPQNSPSKLAASMRPSV